MGRGEEARCCVFGYLDYWRTAGRGLGCHQVTVDGVFCEMAVGVLNGR